MRFRLLAAGFAIVLATVAQADDRNVISRIDVEETAAGARVRVDGSAVPSFTQFTLTAPRRLVIDLAGAEFAGPGAEIPGLGPVASISTSAFASSTARVARVTVRLVDDAPYDIRADGTDLVIEVQATGTATLLARVDADEARRVAEARARAEAERNAAEARAREEALARAEAERKAEEARVREEALARAEAERKAEEARAREEAIARAEAERNAAEARAREEALARAEAERKAEEARAREEALARAEAERKAEEARAREEAIARAEAERKAEEARAREEAIARAEAARQAEEARKAAIARAESDRIDAARREQAQREQARKAAIARAESDRIDAVRREQARRAEAESRRIEAARRAQAQARSVAARRRTLADAQEGIQPGARYAQLDTGSQGSREGAIQVSNAPKVMSLVGFQQLGEASRVFIRTNEPVRYSVDESGDVIYIDLENTRAATANDLNHLDTRFFESAIFMIQPEEIEGAATHLRIAIRLKQRVPYEIRQEDNEIHLDFRTPAQ